MKIYFSFFTDRIVCNFFFSDNKCKHWINVVWAEKVLLFCNIVHGN